MLTLRCTQKLLDRGLAKSAGAEVPATTLLGDWYASVLNRRPQHLALCVSERTRLPVILPARPANSLPSRLSEAVCLVLDHLGIEAEAVDSERREMQVVRVGRTANRSVLGSLNDFMFQLQVGLDLSPERSLLEQSLRLAQTPCGPMEYASPDRATQALFSATAVIARVGQRAP